MPALEAPEIFKRNSTYGHQDALTNVITTNVHVHYYCVFATIPRFHCNGRESYLPTYLPTKLPIRWQSFVAIPKVKKKKL